MGRRGTAGSAGRIELSPGQVSFCRFEFNKGTAPPNIAAQLARTITAHEEAAILEVVIPILEASPLDKPFSAFSDVDSSNEAFILTRLQRGWSSDRIASLYGFPESDGDLHKFIRQNLRAPGSEKNPAEQERPARSTTLQTRSHHGSASAPQNPDLSYRTVDLSALPSPPPAPRHWSLAGRGRNAAGQLLGRTGLTPIWLTHLEDWEIRALAVRFFNTPATREQQRKKAVYIIVGLKHGTPIEQIADDSVQHSGGTRESVLALIRFLLGP